MHLRKLVFPFLFTLLLASCGPKVSVMGTHPAEVGLPGVKTLFVQKFQGEHRFETRRCLLAVLSASDRFTVLDQEIDDRPEWDWADVRGRADVAVDDVRGLDSVAYHEVEYEDVTVTDSSGAERTYHREIRRRMVDRVKYVKRKVKLTATIMVEHAANSFLSERTATRTKTVKFGGAETHPESSQYSSSALKLSDLNSHDMGVHTFACEAGTELGRLLVPQEYVLQVPLADEGGELVEAGVEHAGQGNWVSAEDAWNRALALEPGNAAALYNLGVARERKGGLEAFGEARELYRRALEFEDGSIYEKGLTRIIERMAEARELERQLAD